MKTQTCFKFPETTYINDRTMAITASRGNLQPNFNSWPKQWGLKAVVYHSNHASQVASRSHFILIQKFRTSSIHTACGQCKIKDITALTSIDLITTKLKVTSKHQYCKFTNALIRKKNIYIFFSSQCSYLLTIYCRSLVNRTCITLVHTRKNDLWNDPQHRQYDKHNRGSKHVQ